MSTPSTVHIEVMVDTNANSRKMNALFKEVREEVEGAEEGLQGELAELREYLEAAGHVTGIEYRVTQRDTAQIYHEKTNTLTPELAEKAGVDVTPNFLWQNLYREHPDGTTTGFYHVEEPVHGEDVYYQALRKFLLDILPHKAPNEDVSGIEDPNNIDPSELQRLYLDHIAGLPKQYREGRRFRKAFAEYRDVRFNAGEETAINFLRNHPYPPEGERTAFIFVGQDNWANQEMGKARKGKEKQDEGRFDSFVTTGPNQFRRLIEQVIRNIEADYPELREFRRGNGNFKKIRMIEGDFGSRGKIDGMGSDMVDQVGTIAREGPFVQTDAMVRDFAGFVTARRDQANGQVNER